MKYRNITRKEVLALEKQGCTAESWETVYVRDPFVLDRVRHVRFSGVNSIGVLNQDVQITPGRSEPSGLYCSSFHNCSIGDHVRITHLLDCSCYTIGSHTVIHNVGTLAVQEESTFGNGTGLDVLNEAGGRVLKMYDRLTAQIAYLLVVYRHRPGLIAKLDEMIGRYTEGKRSRIGTIGPFNRITDTSQIINVNTGPFTEISGALHLENGTIAGCEEDPVLIGPGVEAKNFIILSGTRVEGSVMLQSCFLGQGIRMGKQYSAENSAFFANCEGFHGEAVSLFAGPYTVTHHKSTLLIAGLLSFYNAGSGTNQSNHMYKLGPVHQGILERGSKTGSFSYLLWPCRIGAFSVVIGKHYTNFDASEFPFSYISEEDGKSYLTPAMNLFTVGTRRDSRKWPDRDRRKGPEKLDLIHFPLFNPYVADKMVHAAETLRKLSEQADKARDFIVYKGIRIKRLLLKTCSQYYEMAIKIYLGEGLISSLFRFVGSSLSVFLPAGEPESGPVAWCDAAGLLVRSDEIERLVHAVENDEIKDLEGVEKKLGELYSAYEKEEQAWCFSLLGKRLGKEVRQITREDLKQIVRDWKENAVKLNNMILKDALKEFDESTKIGFGADGDVTVRDADFLAVRGTFDKDKFVMGLRQECQEFERKAAEALEKIEQIKDPPLHCHHSREYAVQPG
ncbi:MAG: DUF4954 family protein [bacterium]|nr:DUF4954 family protein [bacterium]